MAKKKKKKVIYYDDNSTISDMTGVGKTNGRDLYGRRMDRLPKKKDSPPKQKSTAQDKWRTYWTAVRMMFLPMCVVLGVLAVIFLFLYCLGNC